MQSSQNLFSVDGKRIWIVVSWGAPRAEPVAAYRPFDHLRTTTDEYPPRMQRFIEDKRRRGRTRHVTVDGPVNHRRRDRVAVRRPKGGHTRE